MFLHGIMKILKYIILLSFNILYLPKKIRNPLLLPIVEKEVKKFFDSKIIIPTIFSKWLVNLVPVRKKNGEIRLCIDFRNLNRASLKDNYPLPKMDHILKRVVGATRISMLDGF
jgi:hypothetical protein